MASRGNGASSSLSSKLQTRPRNYTVASTDIAWREPLAQRSRLTEGISSQVFVLNARDFFTPAGENLVKSLKGHKFFCLYYNGVEYVGGSTI